MVLEFYYLRRLYSIRTLYFIRRLFCLEIILLWDSIRDYIKPNPVGKIIIREESHKKIELGSIERKSKPLEWL